MLGFGVDVGLWVSGFGTKGEGFKGKVARFWTELMVQECSRLC